MSVSKSTQELEAADKLPKVEVSVNTSQVFPAVPSTTLAKEQKHDNQLGPVYTAVERGVKPTLSQIYKVKSKLVRKLLLQFDRLVLKERVLHRLYIQNDLEYHQMILPSKYRLKVLQSLHDDMGHQSLDRTLSLLRERFYWPTMAADSEQYVRECRRCQTAKGEYTELKTQQGSLVANNPLDLLCMDFTKVDPSQSGKENVLVLTDAFSKFSQAFVTTNQKALTVAKVLVEKWFMVYGIPARIHSDKGRSFENEVIRHLCSMYGIKQSTTTPYNPRGNSQCERFNRTLFGLLKSLTKEQKAQWPQYLPALVFAYNATPHSTTKFQPYELMFGRKAPAPCDKWLGLAQYDDIKSTNKVQWIDRHLEQICSANRRALQHIKTSTEKSALRNKGKELYLPVGRVVLLKDHPEGRKKIQDKYKSELFTVIKRGPDPNVYTIQSIDGKGPTKKVNRRQLFDLKRSREEELRAQEEYDLYDPMDRSDLQPPKLTLKKVSKNKNKIQRPQKDHTSVEPTEEEDDLDQDSSEDDSTLKVQHQYNLRSRKKVPDKVQTNLVLSTRL